MFGPLGHKLIAHISIGGFPISFDLMTIIMSWIVIALLVILAFILRKSLRQDIDDKPNRVQALLDALIDLIKSQLTSSFASDQLARDLFPFIATLFMFILLSNWISVIPLLESPTKDLNVTFSFGLLVFFMSQYFAIKRKGFGKYMKGFIEPYPLMLPLNIVGEIAKPL
ncbi:MAG TPA: F0F1 ATP synthase subunit A, partial [Candidatus Acetothermia bacterium]|nr:F0F1 ATP synthase subunit A [Candidatus Acetothermia bacterium]HEX32611.1 F0F1 ATP synthase subunit A [Candidatus Acetothermia bacterium]